MFKNNVNILQSTPTKVRMLMNQEGCSNDYIGKLDKIVFSGECLDKNMLNRVKSVTNAKVYDAYAPSETTIWSTVKQLEKNYITVGKPIANMQVWVIDNKRRLLPLMVKGELGISGDSVSDGYYKMMIKHKIFLNVCFTEKKVYMTGDLSIINLDYDVEILNRIDNQIKINGQRIELEEIESLILNNPNVLDVAVSCREGKHLICFIH